MYLKQCYIHLIYTDVPKQFPPSITKIKSRASDSLFLTLFAHYLLFSQDWFATPQLVLQADWQDVWHSPHPPFLALSHKLRVSNVLILSMIYLHSMIYFFRFRSFAKPNFSHHIIIYFSSQDCCMWSQKIGRIKNTQLHINVSCVFCYLFLNLLSRNYLLLIAA